MDLNDLSCKNLINDPDLTVEVYKFGLCNAQSIATLCAPPFSLPEYNKCNAFNPLI